MKKVFLLPVILVGITIVGNAQNDSLERSIQLGYYTDYSCAIKEFPSQNFYLGFTASDSLGYSERTYITRLDDNGATLWQHEAFDTLYETGNVNELIQVYDNNIVLSGYEMGCDVVTGNGYVQKVSRFNGNTLWLKTFELDYSSGFGNAIVELPDSGFWVANKNMLYRLNKTGDSLYAISYNYGKIYNMVITASEYILLGCNNGLIKIDTAGNVIDTFSLPKPVRFIVYKSDSLNNDSVYFIVAGKTFYKTDTALAVLAQDNTLAVSYEINAVKITDDRLWIMLHPSANNECKLLKWDFNFAFIGQHIFSYLNGSDLDVRDMLVNPNSYDLFIHEHSKKLSSHLLIKNWEKTTNTTYSYNTDVGVTGFYADSSYAILNPIGGQTIVYPFFNCYITIKNFGQRPVDDVFLNSVIDTTYALCLPYTYSKKFNGLNLQPGDSNTIYLGWIPQAAYDSAVNPANERYLCFWTSSPGRYMDYDHTNDYNCQVLTVNTFAGINETIYGSHFIVFPNPAEDVLTIKSTDLNTFQFSSITVCDLLGSALIRKTTNDANEIKLAVNKLTPGLYVVKIKSGAGVFIQKFVKQ